MAGLLALSVAFVWRQRSARRNAGFVPIRVFVRRTLRAFGAGI
jgi:hypothetical protein